VDIDEFDSLLGCVTNWCKYVNSSLESKTKEGKKKGKGFKEKGLYIYKVAQASLGH